MLIERLCSVFSIPNNPKQPPYCYAPFGSLYFNLDGRVYGCYQNRMRVLGKYPENSISEIWKGKKINTMRKDLQTSNLRKGCLDCSSIGVDKTKPYLKYKFLKEYGRHPMHFEFQLSNLCNLACKMCVHENSTNIPGIIAGKQQKNIYDSRFVDQLEEFLPHLESAFFLGGEPFLINIFYEIWERMIKINNKAKIYLTSNGTVLNDRVKNILAKGDFGIMLSVDSFNKNTYQAIRKNADFEITMKNVEYFAEYMEKKGENLRVNVCLINDNRDEIPSILEYCNQRHFKIYIIFAIVPRKHSIKYFDSGSLRKLLDAWLSCDSAMRWDDFPANKVVYDNLIEQVEAWYREAIEFEHSNLYQINDSKKLSKLLIDKFHTSFEKEMNYLNKKDRALAIININNAINKAKEYLEADNELINILKTMHRFPAYEFIIEGLRSDETEIAENLLMFR